MQTEYVDVYFMHRDNPDVPVGEFVDAMDAEVRAGRIRGPIGGSNWTRERMDEAIAYAERTGKTRPSVLSNNFSLAEMVDPVWPGCIASSDAAWKEWLKQNRVTNFAWSSQARGFFTDRAAPGKMTDLELARAWYSDLNFQRKARAAELGRRLGKDPIQVALGLCPAPALACRSADRSGDACGASPQSGGFDHSALGRRRAMAGARMNVWLKLFLIDIRHLRDRG